MVNQNNQSIVKETWVLCQFITKDSILEEYPGYEVSNLGRIRSLNYHHTGKPKVMKPGATVDSNGTYYKVQLWKDKKSHWRRIHRLVLSSFNPKGYFKGAVVDHVDSNSSNNRLSNLRWTTQQENCSTPHFKALLTNHPSFSKRVKVTFLDDGHCEVFPSTREAERTLELPKWIVAQCIRRHNGYYKKLNVLFEYI